MRCPVTCPFIVPSIIKHSAAKYERRRPSCGAQRRSATEIHNSYPTPKKPKTASRDPKNPRAARCYSFVVECCLCLHALLQRVARIRNCKLAFVSGWIGSLFFESNVLLSTFSFLRREWTGRRSLRPADWTSQILDSASQTCEIIDSARSFPSFQSQSLSERSHVLSAAKIPSTVA